MAAPANPFEVARETFKELVQRRIPPTPENYRKLYFEMSGVREDEISNDSSLLKPLARMLPRDTPERMRLGRELDQALTDGKDAAKRAAFDTFLASFKAQEPPAWNELIGDLLQEWEKRQIGWTTARKRQALDKVLQGSEPNTLYARLQGLTRSWNQSSPDPDSGEPVAVSLNPVMTSEGVATIVSSPPPPEVKLLTSGETGDMLQQFRQLLVEALDKVVPAFLVEHPELVADAERIGNAVKASRRVEELETVGVQLRKFAIRLEMVSGDVAEIRSGLLSLLRLLLENIDQLVLDDAYLHGQMETLREIVEKPATLKMIDDAERRLKDLIIKQSQLKAGLSEAQQMIKAMLAGFVDQLAHIAESSGQFHDHIGSCADRISQAKDIREISGVLNEVMRETRNMQHQTMQSRDELQSARRRVLDAEARILRLQAELEEASRNMRHDPLTGILNRRGLEETIEKEVARTRRRHSPLCMALIDVDNFKKLNDQHGHQAGDEALKLLANVVKNSLRPHDTVGRYGGEEFVVVLPDTRLQDAVIALTRLQRELTKTFFLAGNQKLLITFSAGVTQLGTGEDPAPALERADQAMYAAKQAGKNRVQAVPGPP